MNSELALGLIAIAIGIPQAIAGTVEIVDRLKVKRLEVDMTTGRRGSLWLAFFLYVGTLTCILFAAWLHFDNPFQPTTVEKIIYVDKAVPCPPAKTGPASTRGTQSPAYSGTNNSTTYGGEPNQPQKPPK